MSSARGHLEALVTSRARFLGGVVVAQLLETGHRVIIFHNSSFRARGPGISGILTATPKIRNLE